MGTIDETFATTAAALERARVAASDFLHDLPERRVGARATYAELVRALGGPLPAEGAPASDVVDALARAVDPGIIASAGPRYFGFVIGGALPAACAADWLTSVWDQNAASSTSAPAAGAAEAVVAAWILDLLRLPADAAVGFVTGGQMANFSCLAAGRHAVLERAGWDVEARGLQGAPEVHVVVGEEAHATIFSSLRMLGFGSERARRVPVDGQGRMKPDALANLLGSLSGPVIVCAQAGNVNTGAFDPCAEIAAITRERGAWLHVDGAFGLWVRAAPARHYLVEGLEGADSWATDAHKWLNTPYDSGIAIVRERKAMTASFVKSAAYLMKSESEIRDNHDFTPESSRRARGFVLWAALRSLGRRGVTDLVERSCRLAARMADHLRAAPGARVLNEVALNQVLVRFAPRRGGDEGAFTKAVMERVQRSGVCWLGSSHWQGQAAIRISISNWSTSEADIDRSAAVILRAVEEEQAT